MIYINNSTHKWDSCAGEAIVKSMGGYFTTPKGQDIVYNGERETTANKEGMVTALDK
jgi:3'-phosphoadenosine 5'-phosphosulfate (PAPS) 3'-phosphatase